MKVVLALFFALLIGNGCDSQLKDWEEATLLYSSMSRGARQEIHIAFGKVKVSGHRLGEAFEQERELTDTEKKNLYDLAQKLNLEGMQKLQAPSNDHRFDGAPLATLRIVYKNNEYVTPTFDHGNPPSEVQSFVNQILALAPEKK